VVLGRIGAAILLVSVAACARTPSSTRDVVDAPTAAVLTCGADGSVELSTDVVRPQPDGVHLAVVNRFDEPVSVEGFDADRGRTDWVLANGPGEMQLMCWPFSQHGSGEPPPRHRLRIVDPEGLYFDASVSCEFDGSSTVDYAEVPVEEGRPPDDVVHDLLTGLRADDVLRTGGYPEENGAPVAVVRDGEVVASYSFGRFRGEPWSILGASVCPGTGLRFQGESFH
jgi:hypothetical protein